MGWTTLYDPGMMEATGAFCNGAKPSQPIGDHFTSPPSESWAQSAIAAKMRTSDGWQVFIFTGVARLIEQRRLPDRHLGSRSNDQAPPQRLRHR